MPIALLTDFGLEDGYVGVMKAVISSIHPQAQILDLTHNIPPQDIDAARFVLWNSYSYFPKGTIFVCVVDPGVGSNRPILAVQTDSHIFLVPDNGLMDFVYPEVRVRYIYSVENPNLMRPGISKTFHGRDIFAPVAAYLSKGFLPTQLGPLFRYRLPESPFVPIKHQTPAMGKVIYVDHFGNLITNFHPYVDISGYLYYAHKQVPIFHTYSAVKKGEQLALTGSHGLMEIAVREGSAAEALDAKVGDKVYWRPT